MNSKFASSERAVQNSHPHMLTENPTELLTEELTETDRTFDRWVLKSSGHPSQVNMALLKNGQDIYGADLTSRRAFLAIIGAEQATP